MHGKILTVGRGLGRYQATDKLKDPTGVKYTQPMMREKIIQSGEDEGKLGLYIPSENGLIRAAVVEKSGFGAWDEVGSYSKAMNADDLMNSNIGPPPLHYRCRSVILPYI
jgi:hypothetical protein